MNSVAVIYDLDETIFPTSKIPAATFEPVFNAIRTAAAGHLPDTQLEAAFAELWRKPIDLVAQAYGFTKPMTDAYHYALIHTDYQLDITPFNDFPVVKQIPGIRALVTTGITKLQQAKIDALFQQDDFDVVVIDDPLQDNRLGKKKIFASLAAQFKLKPEQVWVVGDSPDSEIAAGNELGMNTVQIIRPGIESSDRAKHTITSFHELKVLIESAL